MKTLTIILILPLVSCGTMDMVKKTSASTTAKIAGFSRASLTAIRPERVKVVEVREKDLKALPTGKELALAHQSKSRRSFWFFGGPVDFKEPALPQDGADLNDSLLPPKPE